MLNTRWPMTINSGKESFLKFSLKLPGKYPAVGFSYNIGDDCRSLLKVSAKILEL
jgi:hypothetical protein